MKKVYFRKTTEYYSAKDKDQLERFDFLAQLTLQTINPKPLHEFRNIEKDIFILHSPLNRVLLSLPLNSNHSSDINLKEVLFDLKKFCSFGEFKKEGSVMVRKKFKEFFIADMLPEKRSSLFKGIKLILKRIEKMKEKEILVISHSFKLKLIEVYLKTNGKIEQNPKLIHLFIKEDEKTFDFEDGFDITL